MTFLIIKSLTRRCTTAFFRTDHRDDIALNHVYCDLLITQWGRVTHICVSKLTIIGSDNVLAPGRRQTIIWTNDGILLIGPLGTNFSESLIGIQTFSFKKMHLNKSSAKWRPFCLGLNVLRHRMNLKSDIGMSLMFNWHEYRYVFNWISAIDIR